MVFLICALASSVHRLTLPSQSICVRVEGKIVAGARPSYTIHVNKGDRFVVNSYGTSRGFGVVATVKFPDGSADGNKGTPSVDTVIKKSGTCTISVGPNMMMDISRTGTFELEVVRYHPF